VFEFESDRLGAQAALGGGGRYDGLVEELGGPPTPGVGWAAGVERMLLAAGDAEQGRAADVFIASAEGTPDALVLAQLLRGAGYRTQMEQAGRGMKGQLKHANRLGAPVVVIVGGPEIEVKDMDSGEQRPAGSLEDAVSHVEELLR
jgi:histidyl-tRNA synthetase